MLYFNDLTSTNKLRSTTLAAANLNVASTTDIQLDANGEILIDRLGQITTTTGGASIIANLIRRITTPLGGYERLAFTKGNNYSLVDLGWSDPLINQLSAPLTPAFTEWSLARLADLTAKDSRLTVLAINLIPNASAVQLSIDYTLNSQSGTTAIALPQPTV